MDYVDFQANSSNSSFWFRAKKELIGILLASLQKRELKILNIGTGTGDELEILNEFGHVYIIDVESKALDLIPPNLYVEKKTCDACNLDYPDEYFDVVTSFDVFEHIPDDICAVGQIQRVLKNGGDLIFSVPACQFLFGPHDEALGHHRRYSKRKLISLLGAFRELRLHYWNSMPFLPIAISRVLGNRSKPKLAKMNFPPLIDALFYKVLSLENKLIARNFSLPLGITIVGKCKKQETNSGGSGLLL